jgi:hypothetical protein
MILNVVSRGYDLARDCRMALHIASNAEECSSNAVAREEFKEPGSGRRGAVVERKGDGIPAAITAPAGGGKDS